jgi:hypothetical protein
VRASVIEYLRIRRHDGEHLAQLRGLVALLPQDSRRIGWHIVIIEELHAPVPGLICRAFSVSISAR